MFITQLYTLLILLVSIYVISSQNESIYESDTLKDLGESNEEFNLHNPNYELYNISKHVFYWLYTRSNTTGQLLNRSEPHMIEKTNYDVNNPLKVVVHGWLSSTQDKDGLCTCLYHAYFKIGDYNVICVDWKQYSTDLAYASAKLRAKPIGKDIAKVINKITRNLTVGAVDLHLIGHSMGAHIVGFTGKALTNQVPRITGLDPARPLYENNKPEDRLDASDAHFVDIIHTNGNKNGILKRLGDIDFYPNGGKSQPNCPKVQDKSSGSCSHFKSYFYFAHSIWSQHDYVAYSCSSWEDYVMNKCKNQSTTLMGEHVDERQSGSFYLNVTVEDKCFNY